MFNTLSPLTQIIRLFHSTPFKYAIHKTFRKVLGSNSGRKRKLQFQEFPLLNQIDPNKDFVQDKGKSSSRRSSMLNKMFMKYVTDLIVNGEYWEQYSNLGVEVTRVQIAPNYKQLNVYWISNKNMDDHEVSTFLNENAYTLRYKLTQLRVMSVVPPIVFVKDKHQFEIMELDRRLAIADYGDDYELSSVDRVKHQLELHSTKVNANVSIGDRDTTDGEDELVFKNELPEMPQNVLSLDHAEIMNRLFKEKEKSENNNYSVPHARQSFIESNQNENTSSRDAFNAFLKKRQLINQKLQKVKKNYSADMEYLKQEFMDRSSNEHYDNIENNLDKFDDFIVDDDMDSK